MVALDIDIEQPRAEPPAARDGRGSPLVPLGDLARQAATVRRTIVESLHATGGGHFGGSLSVTDILVALYGSLAAFGCDDSSYRYRDRVILSKGHAAIALYAVLAERGLLSAAELRHYGQFGRNLEGHPDMTVTNGVDFSAGSLGQGIAIGIGMALALRDAGAHVWVVVGDGECQEGEIWEGALLAVRYKLDNLHVIVDENGAQEFGWKHRPDLDPVPVRHLSQKWRAFGWDARDVDGHDLGALVRAFAEIRATAAGRGAPGDERPSVAVARTRKGFGCALFQSDPERYHCAALSDEEYRSALSEVTWKSG
jgi:transketolase